MFDMMYISSTVNNAVLFLFGSYFMKKKVLVISTTMRKGSKSEVRAQSLGKGATDGCNEVKIIGLRGKKLSFCIGW